MHSGMTGLVGAARDNANMTLCILDNSSVAMTGTQETMATGDALYNVVRGLGVPEEHIKIINPLRNKMEQNAAILKAEVEYRGLSVIILRRICVQAARKARG